MTKLYGTPGPRAVVPAICTSRSLGRCDLLANVIFVRLIVLADDQGRFYGDARDIAVRCIPLHLEQIDQAEVATALDCLEREHCILRYVFDGEPYLQLLNWWKYQSGLRRAYPSQYPAPGGWEDRVYGLPGQETPGPSLGQLPQPKPPIKPPQSAAIRAETPRNSALPVPLPNTVPVPPRAAPSWDERPWPTYHQMLNPPGARESG